MAGILLILAACGGNNGGTPAASPDPTESPAAGNSPIVIEHAREPVKLDGPALRVVALEWTYVEDLLALGVQPVGVADISNYNSYINIPPQLDAGVEDVGTRSEPNLDAITALAPDLIIAASFRTDHNYDQLNAIAPTLVFNAYPAEGDGDQFAEMEQTFRAIAEAVGKQEEGEQVLQDMHDQFKEFSEQIKEAGMENEPVVLTQAFSANNVPQFRLFTDNSMAMKILNHIGLSNAYQNDSFQVYGYADATIEALPALQEASFIHTVPDNDNIFENQLKDNPVWNGLDFVQENRVYALGGDTWPFGGPLSAIELARKTVELLAP